MSSSDTEKLMRELAASLGLKAIALEPSVLLQAAERLLGEQLKVTLKEILSDADEALTDALVTKFYEEIEDDAIINAIAGSLAKDLLKHFSENSDDLIEAIVDEVVENRLDFDEIKDMVAQKIADRIFMEDPPKE
jgi:hypothetical protein